MDIVYSVISFVLGVGVVVPYVLKLQNVLKQVAELIVAVAEAPDNGIGTDDWVRIKKEADDVVEAVKAFKNK